MSFSASQLIELLSPSVEGDVPDIFLQCSSLGQASAGSLSFHIGTDASGPVRTTKASAILVPDGFHGGQPDGCALLRVDDPYASMILVMQRLMVPFLSIPASVVHDSAVIHPTAVVEGSVGAASVVGPHAWIAAGSEVGEGCVIDAGACIHERVKIGNGCHLLAGCIVGGRGFGFHGRQGERKPVPHFGGARIGHRCEIGANSIVAAGFLEPTVLGDDVYLDSLVQIGHNCRLGSRIMMAAQSGLAGSVVVEDDVELGGGAQVAGHLMLGKGSRIAAKSGVTRSIPAGQTVAGFPAVSIAQWRRMVVHSRRSDS